MKLVDSHCHLHFPGLVESIPDVILRMQKAQINYALTVATCQTEWSIIKTLVEQYTPLFGAIGIHPDLPDKTPCNQAILLAASKHPKIVALGEAGLDYHYVPDAASYQQERFIVHLEAAKSAKLPIIIHCRDATADMLAILKAVAPVSGVMHCFSENCEVAKTLLDLGLYISLSGIVTFKNAKTLQDVANYLPQDRLLIETDAPYLAPVPHRGQPNEPSYVYHVAKYIAHLRGIPLDILADAITQNFLTCFPKITQYHADNTLPH
ncbi:MAG: TatD family hydrolase [Neisseriales bacterium]|nr:MAG: TatD family hydrolase [Neisseriales bacterium]